MGALDDAKKAMDQMMAGAQQGGGMGMAQMGAASAEAQANQEAQIAQVKPEELDPIDGMSFERYVELAVLMADAGTDTAKHEEIAVANGEKPGTFAATAQKWSDRMMASRPLLAKFNLDYGKKSGIR